MGNISQLILLTELHPSQLMTLTWDNYMKNQMKSLLIQSCKIATETRAGLIAIDHELLAQISGGLMCQVTVVNNDINTATLDPD
jgi:hypothetical protein